MGYHKKEIKPGVVGQTSKVLEELQEFEDAMEQHNRIMAAVELSDVYGALEALAESSGYSMHDLMIMSNATKSAFLDGTRKSKSVIPEVTVTLNHEVPDTPEQKTPLFEVTAVNKMSYPRINYKMISDAVLFYRNHGFHETTVPWIVTTETLKKTLPTDKRAFTVDDNACLVGSAEQSFIELMVNDHLYNSKKYVAVTPCFRDDDIDEIHQKYFMKVELFCFFDKGMGSSEKNAYDTVKLMYNCAFKFFSEEAQKYSNSSELTFVHVDPRQCDIMLNGIEIGSYGTREINDEYIVAYGTGLAEPRFSLALMNQKRESTK